MDIDFTFLPRYDQLCTCQGSTPFTETGESGSLMVVAATVYGAMGNRSSWQAFLQGGTLQADSRRDLWTWQTDVKYSCVPSEEIRKRSQLGQQLQQGHFLSEALSMDEAPEKVIPTKEHLPHRKHPPGFLPGWVMLLTLLSPSSRRLWGIGESVIVKRALEQDSLCKLAWGCSREVCQRERVAQRRYLCDFATFCN